MSRVTTCDQFPLHAIGRNSFPSPSWRPLSTSRAPGQGLRAPWAAQEPLGALRHPQSPSTSPTCPRLTDPTGAAGHGDPIRTAHSPF